MASEDKLVDVPRKREVEMPRKWKVANSLRLGLPLLILLASSWLPPPPRVAAEQQSPGLVHTFSVEGSSYDVEFSNDGRFIGCAPWTDGLVLRSARTWRPLRGFRSTWAARFCFSPDAKSVAFEGAEGGPIFDDKTIRICDVQTSEEQVVLRGHKEFIQCFKFVPDGKQLVSCDAGGTIEIWDLSRREAERTLKGHDGPIFDLALSRDSRLLATAGVDHTVKIWDVRTGRKQCTLEGHDWPVVGVCFSPDAGTLVSWATGCGRPYVWDVAKGELRFVAAKGDSGARFHAITADSRYAIVSQEDELSFWDLRTGSEAFALPGHSGLNLAVLSPHENLLACGYKSGLLKLVDIEDRKVLKTVSVHSGEINNLCFSPDGRLLVSFSSKDHRVKVWDVSRLLEIRRPQTLPMRMNDLSTPGSRP
jgi:WD40 repeat protein